MSWGLLETPEGDFFFSPNHDYELTGEVYALFEITKTGNLKLLRAIPVN